VEERDLVIIGGGPAGYVAAIRASQLGGKVTLVEHDKLGGTCLNRGCVPSKSLLRSLELCQSIKNAGQYGINTQDISIDLAKMMAHKNRIVAMLVGSVQNILNGNKVEVRRSPVHHKMPIAVAHMEAYLVRAQRAVE